MPVRAPNMRPQEPSRGCQILTGFIGLVRAAEPRAESNPDVPGFRAIGRKQTPAVLRALRLRVCRPALTVGVHLILVQ